MAILRSAGFVGTLAGPHVPAALVVPYLTMAMALAFGYWGISRGVIIEPPAFITNAVTMLTERIAERSARLAGSAR